MGSWWAGGWVPSRPLDPGILVGRWISCWRCFSVLSFPSCFPSCSLSVVVLGSDMEVKVGRWRSLCRVVMPVLQGCMTSVSLSLFLRPSSFLHPCEAFREHGVWYLSCAYSSVLQIGNAFPELYTLFLESVLVVLRPPHFLDDFCGVFKGSAWGFVFGLSLAASRALRRACNELAWFPWYPCAGCRACIVTVLARVAVSFYDTQISVKS